MTVRLHIERLVVEGLELSAAEGARLEGAIAGELGARFAADEGLDWSGFAVPSLPPLQIDARTGAIALGREIAAAMHCGISLRSPPGTAAPRGSSCATEGQGS